MFKSPFKKSFTSGFTLIELLVVITIIALLASVVMVGLEESRQKTRNTARVTQLNEYIKAFNMHFADKGYYPRYSTTGTAYVCLGDYASNTCWRASQPSIERASFNASIVPQYLSQFPPEDLRVMGDQNYTGMVYVQENGGRSYRIMYLMEGSNRPCILDKATATVSGSDTLCTYIQPE